MRDRRPKRITIASVRAVLKGHGCTIEESCSEFRVDPPAGMGFDFGELSQRVFCYCDEVPAGDRDSRARTLEGIYDEADDMSIALAPWKADGDYQAAIDDVLRHRLGDERAAVDLRHVEAWLLSKRSILDMLGTRSFQSYVLEAYRLTISREPSVSEARARELGI